MPETLDYMTASILEYPDKKEHHIVLASYPRQAYFAWMHHRTYKSSTAG